MPQGADYLWEETLHPCKAGMISDYLDQFARFMILG
jgi:hypothetical protein